VFPAVRLTGCFPELFGYVLVDPSRLDGAFAGDAEGKDLLDLFSTTAHGDDPPVVVDREDGERVTTGPRPAWPAATGAARAGSTPSAAQPPMPQPWLLVIESIACAGGAPHGRLPSTW